MTTGDPVELVMTLYPALASGDRSTLDELLHPEFVGDTTAGLPLGLAGHFEGADAMRRRFWGVIARNFDVVAEPSDFQLLPDGRVMVGGVYRGCGRRSGTKFTADFVHFVTVAEGRLTGLTQLTDSAAWIAGLGEVDDDQADTVGLEVVDGVAHIRLDRPDAANAIDVSVAYGIRRAAQRCASDPRVRAVLISGAGDRFSAGGDLKLFADLGGAELSRLLDGMITDFHIGLALLAELPVPVVCAVQGAAAGGALGIMHAADIVIAAEGTKFAAGFGLLALSGDGGSTWYLPRLVGPKIAAQMYLDNRVLTADEALRSGLISEIVPADELGRRSEALAARLAIGPTHAFGAMRRLLRGSATSSLVDQLDAERRSLIALAAQPEAREGIAAFVQKRRPDFGADHRDHAAAPDRKG